MYNWPYCLKLLLFCILGLSQYLMILIRPIFFIEQYSLLLHKRHAQQYQNFTK